MTTLALSRGIITTPPNSLTRSQPSSEDLAAYLPSVETTARVVWLKYRDFLQGRMEFEDLYQIGVMGLMDAAKRWDPTGEASFWTFAEFRVKGSMVDAIRNDPGIPMARNHENVLRTESLDRQDAPVFQQPSSMMVTNRMLATMTARELRIIHMHWYEDLTLDVLGHKLGITEGRVSQLIDRMLPKLKRGLTRGPIRRGALIQFGDCWKRGPNGASIYTNFQALMVQRMHSKGKSLARIGIEISRPKSTVHTMLHKDTAHMPSQPGTFHRIHVSNEVFDEIARRGVMRESVDDVLRRVLEMAPKKPQGTAVPRRSPA